MNLSVLATLAILAATSRNPGPSPEAVREALIARIEKAVVLVNAESGQGESREGALGSGVVISPDGLVVTAAHVVDRAQALDVRLFDGTGTSASVLFVDDALDLALLRMAKRPSPESVAELGDSDALKKGSTLYVIGNPLGLELSVAQGIVSGRHTPEHVFGTGTGAIRAELIQTDAAMNRGVSGGPMFDSQGRVVAIAQSILTSGGGSEGLGFGVAINTVKDILRLDPCLYLGFSAIPLDGELADAFNTGEPSGLLVQYVAPGSPAERAGLRAGRIVLGEGRQKVTIGGDIVTHVDGIPVKEWKQSPFRDAQEGDVHAITFRVVRAGKVTELTATMTHRGQW